MAKWVFRPSDALRVIGRLTEHIRKLPDKEYALEIKEYKQKRSLDANAYAWVLINRIAGVTALEPERIYRDSLRKCGGNIEFLPIRNDALERWNQIWSGKGLGWQTETLGPCKNLEGYVTVACYYGSSVLDTKQMSNLIENLIKDARALGVETITPAEKKRLIEMWN